MAMTIKQLADELGVSKTAIRNYMDEEFRAKYTEKDRKGVITIDSDGCKVIAETFGNQCKESESSANHFPETAENTENHDNIVIPRIVWEVLQKELEEKNKQLEAKDKQLEVKDEQIRKLTELTDHAQQLHAGSIKQMLPDSETKVVEAEEKKHIGLLNWLFGK